MMRTLPRYDRLFSQGKFNGTLLIGPDPLGANFDYQVFLQARRKLRTIGFQMTYSERGMEEYERIFSFGDRNIAARMELIMGRNYGGSLEELWRNALEHDDFIYLKTHAGYGRHISLSDDVSYFTDAMKKGSDHSRRHYQLFYLDCCKSELYYKEVIRDYVGEDVDLILNKWFCDYKIIGPVVVLIDELMKGSDFETIISKMNDEYGIPHFDVEDKPEDKRLDRKMVTYSISHVQ